MVSKWTIIEGAAWVVTYCLLITYNNIKFLPVTLPVAFIFNRVSVLFWLITFWLVVAIIISIIGGIANLLGYLED
ncbi:MAG: hypothetical protein WBB28_15825 [Crinalium sp.]